MLHKHHKIPKHSGGSDDPENIVYLTPEEHAEAHKKLYEETGNKYDFLAWKGLAGQIGKDEILKQIYSENGKKAAKKNFPKIPWNKGKKNLQTAWCKGFTKETHPGLAKLSRTRTGKKHTPETIEKLRAPKSQEHKEALAESLRNYHKNKVKK